MAYDIEHSVLVAATAEEIWPCLTTRDGLVSWWTIGHTDVSGDMAPGGEFDFSSGPVVTRLRVIAQDAPAHLEWRTVASNAPGGWDGTMITFDLRGEGEGEGTRIDFAHRGFAEDNDGYRKVTAGWGQYLGQLKQVVEAVQEAREEA